MIAIAIAAQLGDLVTFLIMGVEYELNPVVAETPVAMSVIAKLLLICVICLMSIAASKRHPKVMQASALIIVVSAVLGLIGTTSNLGVLLDGKS